MDQAEQLIHHVCGLTEVKQVKDCEKHQVELPENLGTHCHEWPAGRANAEVQMFVKANSKPLDNVIYMDGSVTKVQSGWGFTVKQVGRTAQRDSGAYSLNLQSVHGAGITSGLMLGRAEVFRGLGNFLNRPEHHSIDRLKERGVEKGSSPHSTF